MLKKVLSTLVIGTSLFLGENTMAENALNEKQQSVAEVAAYAARGDQKGLRQALINGFDKGLTVNEYKEILTQVYA